MVKSSYILVLLACLLLQGCLRRTLLTELSETEAREVAVALYKGNVHSLVSKQPKGRGQDEQKWQVDVQGGDRTLVEAWRIMEENGLPRHREAGVEEVYKNGQLIATASEERAKFLLAMSGELSRSLKTIPGVVDARVHVAIPDANALVDPKDKPKPKASVVLKYWSSYQKPDEAELKAFLSKAVEGLEDTNIKVYYAKLETPHRDAGEDVQSLVKPTVGLALDYISWCGMAFLILFAVWATFNWVPDWLVQLRRGFDSLKYKLTHS
jgi:type III secretion protein J